MSGTCGSISRASSPDTAPSRRGRVGPAHLRSRHADIGFARRFATYKRPNLLLRDRDRLLRILTNRAQPVQLVIAGKAHPQDREGQEMIRQWIDFIRHSPARQHAVFLADYDMQMTEHLVRGVDIWLNNPRRPWEASGTSGMKVLVNGGLNLSELDGWWAEAYSPEMGVGSGSTIPTRVGLRGCPADLFAAGIRSRSDVLSARSGGRSGCVDRAGACKYVAPDPKIFRQSRGPRVHGNALSCARQSVL